MSNVKSGEACGHAGNSGGAGQKLGGVNGGGQKLGVPFETKIIYFFEQKRENVHSKRDCNKNLSEIMKIIDVRDLLVLVLIHGGEDLLKLSEVFSGAVETLCK